MTLNRVPIIITELARAKSYVKWMELSISDFSKALRLNPMSTTIRLNLAEALCASAEELLYVEESNRNEARVNNIETASEHVKREDQDPNQRGGDYHNGVPQRASGQPGDENETENLSESPHTSGGVISLTRKALDHRL